MKGQATVEFLLTIVISLLLIVTVVMPNYDSASESAKEVVNISKLRVSAEKLANAIEFVSVSGNEAKQTIEVVVPTDGAITFAASGSAPISCSAGTAAADSLAMSQSTKIAFSGCAVDDDTPPAPLKCTKKFTLPSYFCAPAGLANPGIYLAAIKKTAGIVSVTATQIK